MSDEYQIPIPASFQALHRDARGRLTVPLAEHRARYELCEDMAQMLVDTAQAVHHDQGVAQQQVLDRMAAGLRSPGAGFTDDEAGWVRTWLAELLGWPDAALPVPTDDNAKGRPR